ncbi:MAG: outer membrane protein assembly factor BamA [Chitinispirillales bacterium]|jgi:outer membrane protein insertion porin family|nr:outer membrane protein assembly factor BamA [Chitinispirillales bacterium]
MRKIPLIVIPVILAVFVGASNAKVLEALKIEGLEVTQPEAVSNVLELREGQTFTPSDIQESIRRLYRTGNFRSVDFFVDDETDSSVTLTLRLEEFPILDKIEFHGNRKIKGKELEKKEILRLGRPFSDAQLHKSKQVLSDMYADKGYHLAEIEAVVVNTSVPGNVIVRYDIKEGPRVKIKSIVFNGNQDVTEGWLSKRFKTKENRWWRSGGFNRELYRSHLDTLMMHYHEKGFLDAAIERDSIWYSEDKRDIFIEITVNEGRKYVVGDITFTGNRIIETDPLTGRIALAKGKPFKRSSFEMTKFMIENAYREEGYLWVRLDDKRTYRGENADTIDVNFDIFEGRPAIIRKIDVRGNNKTMEKVIRREIVLVPGQRYRQSLMATSQQNIFRLNYFTNIVPDIIPNEDGTIDLVFDIIERDNIGQLTVGAAYSDHDKLTGTFSTAIPNFRGAGQELKLEVQYGNYRRLGMVSFTEPWAWDTPWWLTGTIFTDQQIYSYSDNTRDTTLSYGFRVGVGRSRLSWPDNKFRFQTVYQLSREQNSRDNDTIGNLNLVETGLISKLRFNVERYDLDMPQFPNEGSRLTITPEIAGLGGDYRYLKATATYEQYFRLPGKFVFGSEVKFGAISRLGSGITISGNDLFTGGGAYGDAMIRGYPDWQFGGYRNRAQGDGISMFATNLSLRYPVVDQTMYLGVFADMGNTWSSISGIDLGDLYKGVGMGLRVNLPMIGVMGVDVGYGLDPVNKKDLDAKPAGFNWHIIMNKGF